MSDGDGAKGRKSGPVADVAKGRVKIVPVSLRLVAAANEWEIPVKMRDRREQVTSPYLLDHIDNPVDWWEWGEEAFAAARERDLPAAARFPATCWPRVSVKTPIAGPGRSLAKTSLGPVRIRGR